MRLLLDEPQQFRPLLASPGSSWAVHGIICVYPWASFTIIRCYVLVTLLRDYVTVETYDWKSTVDRRDIRDGRADLGENERFSSAAFSQDAQNMMRDQRLLRQGDSNPISRAENYPPQLSIDASVDPDKEAWRRSNPFDKHYEGGGTGVVRPITFDRSLDPSFQSGYDQQRPGNGEYRVSPYQRNQTNALDFSADPYSQSRRDGYVDNPYRRNPGDGFTDRRDAQPYNGGDRTGNFCRDPNDRKNFYAHQNDAYSCSAFSMAMMASDWNTGRPPSNAESSQWKQIAGTIGQGYRGSLNQVASNLRQGIPDLHTKVYNYGMGKVGQEAMQDLNRELAQGHTAVAKVINPHTGNAHYIYIAGRSSDGGYILGDPDRKNPHQQPISGDRLMRMMSRRDGFVAGWKDSPSMATRSQGSAANRYAMANGRDRDNFATA